MLFESAPAILNPCLQHSFLLACSMQCVFFGLMACSGSPSAAQVCEGGCTTIVDTGTSLLVVSEAVDNQIKSHVNIKENCNDYAANPDMVFSYSGHEYTLKASDYVVEMVDGSSKSCSSAIVPMEGSLKDKISKIVPAGIGVNTENILIMGDVFLRRIYTAFDNSDIDHPKVGMAVAKTQAEVTQFLMD